MSMLPATTSNSGPNQADVTCPAFFLLNEEEKLNLLDPSTGYISRQPRLGNRRNSRKKTLVLDVDHTILCSTAWWREICIGDKLRSKKSRRTFWVVVAMSVTNAHPNTQEPISMMITSMDTYTALLTQTGACVTTIHLSECSNGNFLSVSVAEMKEMMEPYFRTFKQLHEYNLRRPNVSPVSYYCEGLMVRLRPNLARFLCGIHESYDVMLFTAAVQKVYSKVILYAQRSLEPILGDTFEFKRVLFREDCDRLPTNKFHKDLAKLGVDLSEVVIVDDNQNSFRGFEPNAIRIHPFHGATDDDEMMHVCKFLQLVSDVDDVRYPLCNVWRKISSGDEESCSLERACEFVSDLKASLDCCDESKSDSIETIEQLTLMRA